MICTTKDCGRETSLYLCTKCIIELDGLLKQVPLLIVALDPGILAWKVTKAPGANGETRNTNKAASQAPMNIDVDQLRDWLRTLIGLRAYDLAANNPTAEQYLFMARTWVDNANAITHGPEEIKPRDTAEIKQRMVREVPDSLGVKDLLHWLKATYGIKIHPATIWKWAGRGHITRTNEKGHATYSPAAVLVHIRSGAR